MSLVTLFILLVVNNWFVIVKMYVDIKLGNTAWRAFFIAYYYFGVSICMNIVVSFCLDMYGAVLTLHNTKK